MSSSAHFLMTYWGLFGLLVLRSLSEHLPSTSEDILFVGVVEVSAEIAPRRHLTSDHESVITTSDALWRTLSSLRDLKMELRSFASEAWVSMQRTMPEQTLLYAGGAVLILLVASCSYFVYRRLSSTMLGYQALPSVSDSFASTICFPVKWIDSEGDVLVVRKEDSQFSMYLRSEDSEDERYVGQLSISSDGSLSHDTLGAGVFAGDRVFWVQITWHRCQEGELKPGDHVTVLDGNWVDGVVKSAKFGEGGSASYTVLVYGTLEETHGDSVIEDLTREEILKVEIGLIDRLMLLKMGVHFFADMVLDFVAMTLFVAHRQFKYLSANALAIFVSALESQHMLSDLVDPAKFLQTLCKFTSFRSIVSALLGIDFFSEFKEAWRRGYPTQKFLHFRGVESSFEGVGSMLVQMYAFVFSRTYSHNQQLLIVCSILSSVYSYSVGAAIDYYELMYGQCKIIPQDRREFTSTFRKELTIVLLVRFVEVLSRLCLVACFSVVFRPFGIVIWVAAEWLFIASLFRLYEGMNISGAMWNACHPDSWLTAPEAYLTNMQLEEIYGRGRGMARKIIVFTNCVHALQSLAMVCTLYIVKPAAVATILLQGHRRLAFLCGLCASPLAWLLQVVALWMSKNPSLHKFKPPKESTHARAASSATVIASSSCCC